jgi:hypothetical protein
LNQEQETSPYMTTATELPGSKVTRKDLVKEQKRIGMQIMTHGTGSAAHVSKEKFLHIRTVKKFSEYIESVGNDLAPCKFTS